MAAPSVAVATAEPGPGERRLAARASASGWRAKARPSAGASVAAAACGGGVAAASCGGGVVVAACGSERERESDSCRRPFKGDKGRVFAVGADLAHGKDVSFAVCHADPAHGKGICSFFFL